NTDHGFAITIASRGKYYGCRGINNGYSGASTNGTSIGQFFEGGEYSDNGVVGLHVNSFCDTALWTDFTGEISNNGQYGVSITLNSFFARNGRGDFIGNSSGVYTAAG